MSTLIVVTFWITYLIYDLWTTPAYTSGLIRRFASQPPRWVADAGPPPRSKELGPAPLVFLRRVAGGVILAGVPALVALSIPAAGAVFGLRGSGSMGVVAGLLLVVPLAPLMMFLARSREAMRLYPAAQQREWTVRLIGANAATWALYLLGYEICFRGFLLLSLAREFGPATAMAIMLVLYSAVHLTKGPGELLGSLPVGLLLGWLTLKTGTIWAAWFGHVLLAVTAETTCIILRPDRRLVADNQDRATAGT